MPRYSTADLVDAAIDAAWAHGRSRAMRHLIKQGARRDALRLFQRIGRPVSRVCPFE